MNLSWKTGNREKLSVIGVAHPLAVETKGVLYAILVADFARTSDSVHFIENGQIVVAGDVVELDLLVERQ